MIRELSFEQVRWTCDPALFKCDSTLDLTPSAGIIGQGRALSALEFGLNIADSGFNIYVSGLSGTGRTTAIRTFLEALAAKKTPPPDWCCVYNFHDAYSPKALRLPTGMGSVLKKDLEYTIENASRSIAQAFASKEYADKREEIAQTLKKKREASYQFLSTKAREDGFTLQPTPTGLVFIPAYGGQPITPEQYERLSAADKERIVRGQEELNKIMREEMLKLKAEEASTQKKLDDTDREVAQYAISYLFDEMEKKYGPLNQVIDYLNEVKKDITDNLELFEEEPKSPELGPMAVFQTQARRQTLKKYEVNVLVDNSGLKGAPVVLEFNPTYNNLFGRLEKEAQFGALYTDFTMIKSGSLHKANGGYLVARILDILLNVQSWEGLKRALRERKLAIEEIAERLGYVAVKTLTPEPIPFDIKVVLVGDPLLYHLLYQQDPEFKELFKVKADFDSRMEKSEANLKSYAEVICRLCREERLRPLKSAALAKVTEYSTRLSEDQEKLSTLFADVSDIVRESSFWAGADGSEFIEARHVTEAIEKKVYRSNLIQERINEMIGNNVLFIDTEGEMVGQLNGLSVMGLCDFSFGRPSRITASVGVGREGLIDIEREARLGGPIHTKGVMILVGYLMGKYAQSVPLSLSARLVFEQSYEGVEGDSASSSELYTLLSRLAEVPIKQNIAVTGSVNQRGEVQAIGGVNEKIEGFFEVCQIKGLNGKQGVCIPESNTRNLMLKETVVAAVKAGKFHIYTVSTIDEGIEVLTGMKAGKRLPDGSFEPDTFNDKVQKRLLHLSEMLRRYSREGEAGPPAKKDEEEPPVASAREFSPRARSGGEPEKPEKG